MIKVSNYKEDIILSIYVYLIIHKWKVKSNSSKIYQNLIHNKGQRKRLGQTTVLKLVPDRGISYSNYRKTKIKRTF